MKKIAIVLSGSGVFDGAEIHESTMTMLAIAQNGGGYELFAPDIMQHHVINHYTGDEMNEQRNVLVESARIARGKIKSLDELVESDFDAVIFPGGFGVAKNLCSFAVDGIECIVDEEVERVVKGFHAKQKPIGALCISPVLIAKVLGKVDVTIGSDEGTASAIEKLGGKHKETDHGEVVVDKNNLIYTTPCYMLDATITDIYNGATNIVKEIFKII